MSNTSTVNDGYTKLCRSVINNTFEDAYDIRYYYDIRSYINSGNLEIDCFLAKLAYDLVVTKLNEILKETYELYKKSVMSLTNKSDLSRINI